ncbi:MAG TPA: amidohydrolase family protein [Clostridiales bacterium]|nr:amidohydrolase family protein [Clostridiales bacterium]HXK83962.1 amidohydrolase family protein [Clostridiales bacterium]
MEYKIFANHAHVFDAERRPNGTVQELLKLMDNCGISKAVCFAPFKGQTSDPNIDPVEWLAKEIENEPRLVGFGTIDFDRDDIEKQVERIAELGFKGIKVHPAAQEISIVGEKARRMYEVAQEKGLFLSFHTGIHWHRISDYHPILLDEVAFDYPMLQFSLEHIGGYHFFKEALAVMCNTKRPIPRVYAGWTSITPPDNNPPSSWTISDEELRTVIYQTGNEYSIFGLDFPYNREEYTMKAIERIINLDIPEEAKRGVLGENLARVLDVSLDD